MLPEIRILSSKKKHSFYVQYEGSTRRVLTEHSNEEGRLNGFTDNYIKVSIPKSNIEEGQLIDVNLEKAEGDIMISSVLTPSPQGV